MDLFWWVALVSFKKKNHKTLPNAKNKIKTKIAPPASPPKADLKQNKCNALNSRMLCL